MLRRFTSLCVVFLLCLVPMRAQTLAHPGWHGNGIASQAWWKHASFVRMSADITFADAIRGLDAMSEAGVDSMILPDLQPSAGAALPFDERFGTEDDLDALLREASARRMHVLLSIPVERLSAGGGEVRFWMTRGIAGFDVGSVSPGDLSVLRGVRSAMARFPGERILLAHSTSTMPHAAGLQRDPITLHLVSNTEAAQPQNSETSAIDITGLDALSTWPSGVIPIFARALLDEDVDRSRIHNALAQRVRGGAQYGHTGRHR